MQNAMTLGKRAFTIAVAVATILWSISASAFVAPLSASADTSLSNGDLIKGSLSTVYYFYDDERWTFPNEKSFFTWYSDFSDVMTVSDTQLASYPLAGNIVIRPGTWMVKVDTDPKTYVVTRGGEIRWVETEEVAVDLYGEDWNQMIVDVPDVFFTDYDEGTSMMTAELVDGMQVMDGSTVYLIWDGEKSVVTSAGQTANRLMSKFQISDSSVALADYTTGDSTTGEVPALSDSSQQATTSSVASGDLEVSLSNDSPEGQTIPRSTTNAKLMALDLGAGSADVAVSGMTFHFTGVSATTVLGNIYVYWNGARLTNGKTINSTTRDVTFSSLDITVEAGESETIWLTADVADSAFGTAGVSFSVVSADSVTSSAASVDGDFPVESGENTVTSAAEVGTVTIDETGSLSDVVIGQEGAEIGRFTIDADNEDAMIQSITLNIDKAADHSEFELWQSTTKLADGESIGNDLVLFELDEAYTILDGKTKTFKVTAKIGGDPDETIGTALEETGDLVALGGDFGFGMAVTNNMNEEGVACVASTDECSFVTIIGGKLTFAFNGPSAATDLQIGADDQAIFNFTLTSQNDVVVESIEFDVTMTDVDDGTDANFESFRIVKEDGTTLLGPEEVTVGGSTTQSLVFNDEFDMAAGDSWDLSLVVDISDTGDATANDTIIATLDSSETSAEDSDGNDLTVGTDIVPSANLVGNSMVLNDATLTIDLAGSPSSATVVRGSQGVDMVGFSFAAGEASDVTVTGADFHVLVDSDGDDTFDETTGDLDVLVAEDRITSCSLYNSDGDLIDGPESIDTSENVNFDSFDWTIPAGETDKLIVNCDFANLAVVATPDDYAVEIALAADIASEDEEGDSLTATLTDGNTADTIEVSVVDNGTLTFALGSSTPDATILIGNSSDVEVGVFRFNAATESFIIDSVTVNNSGNDRAADSISISYENEDGDTVTSESVLAGGTASFDGLAMFVPASGTADLTLSVDTSAVSTSGATSGDTLVLTLDAETVSRTGVSSGATVTTDLGTDLAADTFELRKTKPTLSKASGSPSGSGVPGLDEVLRFNIAADSHGFVTVDELTFKLTSTDNNGSDWNDCDTGMATTDWSIYNIDDLADPLEAADAEWVLLDSGLAACSGAETLSYVILDLATSVEIAAGSTETYSLYFDTTTASSSQDDTIRIDIPIDSEVATIGGGTDPDGAIIWDDDTTSGTDIDGTYVRTLPVTGGTIVY